MLGLCMAMKFMFVLFNAHTHTHRYIHTHNIWIWWAKLKKINFVKKKKSIYSQMKPLKMNNYFPSNVI